MKVKRFLLALLLGSCFGFLLQKGGVAKYDILMGALLLEDFTVFKVMLSAIFVGMIGVSTLYKLGYIELHIKPLRYVANSVGGLIFGVGFALAGYCPGTEAAAIGQGNFDAIVSASGMIVGSYLFAESYLTMKRIQDKWNLGKKMIYDFREPQISKTK
jgi:hypothetical protein